MITKRLLVPVVLMAMAMSGSAMATGMHYDKSYRKGGDGDHNVFYRMSVGESMTLAQNGPLRLYAECTGQPGASMLELYVVSREDGTSWVSAGFVNVLNKDIPQRVGYLDLNIPPFQPFRSLDPAGAISLSGHFLGFPSAMFLAVGIQDTDCTVVGEVITARERRKGKHRR